MDKEIFLKFLKLLMGVIIFLIIITILLISKKCIYTPMGNLSLLEVEILLKLGRDPNIVDEYKEIESWAIYGDIDNPNNVFNYRINRKTPLICAVKPNNYEMVKSNNYELVKLLIENGAYLSISVKDDLGKTVLDYAKENKNTEIITILESVMKEKGIKIE